VERGLRPKEEQAVLGRQPSARRQLIVNGIQTALNRCIAIVVNQA